MIVVLDVASDTEVDNLEDRKPEFLESVVGNLAQTFFGIFGKDAKVVLLNAEGEFGEIPESSEESQ